MYLNDVKLIGKVRDDATVKTLANGDIILSFVLITMERFLHRDGRPTTRETAHRVVMFNRAAKDATIDGTLFAGTEVLVEGFLRTHESGVTEVVARRISLHSDATA